ncbi:catalase [Bacillus atrophaeus]|uniref:Catalase n=1 Tax=Bacillus atrophaeus (strain 1942) TaxID=720555 RepID=A0ABM5M350_BACA1|nr:catalase [Bacillus atrophaeus]AMR60920.1 catalase HPII [Bacillus subtilis subsp. globigii]ADP34426.1 catalase 2 [Bacillus atrophaeus 1942]AIK47379.1 catalase family protein [Bacillus atrophaeus subsp. globigii]EIM11531.1 catalase 2 [Bacillus atrophaeus C89]KFK81796.1 catalase family protein [Bacillus atrophaeus]
MSKDHERKGVNEHSKDEQLEQYRMDNRGKKMTTNQGLRVSEDEHSLKAGVRGPTLMEDFHFREKMTHFDHERIPERIVHARGYGVHGYFQVYEPMTEFTRAKFLQDPSVKTPVFVRFSTVAGSKGSGDTVRDARGFATKFYTEEGNYDLVGNNIPVFFIQDAIKFPDLVHAFKPEPHNEMPQAATAHDTFWDFVANNPESAHMVMWTMSDRGIPRSYRMMEGFGVHTFRFVNEQGKARFVKFHWKPVLGVHSLVWDEAQKIAGKDTDFHRRDLWETIENGGIVEYELGVQMIDEEDEFKFDFDILDPTKLWPEEIVPVKLIGKMTLNRNQDNVFAETEQVAFHPGNVVPGIDFSNDPLLQGRLFSYTDTQLIRLGGPNFHEIPINRPVCPFHNNQYDGYHRMTINKGPVAYHKNSLQNNDPSPATEEEGGYVHYQEKVEGRKVRQRSESFEDYFSQAKLFWNSMSPVEKQHIISAFCFEVGKVKSKDVQQQVVDLFANVDATLAEHIAEGLGATPPDKNKESNESFHSPALSQANTVKTPVSRQVAVLVENGFHGDEVQQVLDALKQAGIRADIISQTLGTVTSEDGRELEVTATFLTTDSVLYDAVYVAGGKQSTAQTQKAAKGFINEAYSHYKAIGAANEGVELLALAAGSTEEPGLVTAKDEKDLARFNQAFIEAIAEHRHWNRQV